ncbi:hypothetical protein ABMY31_22690, partial [Vibrio vulnificus]
KAKYKWPSKEQNEVFTLTQFELDRLLSGFTIIGHKPAAFFKVVVIIRLFIKQLLSLDLDVRHQLAYSS